MKVCAIVVAAGKSERMGGVDKIEYDLGGATVLERSAAALARNELISELVVVVRAEKLTAAERMFARGSLGKPVKVTSGGETRFLSVQNGIAAASEDTGYYCIHDAARPFVSEGLISRTILAARSCGAAVGGVPVNDTIKIVDGGGFSAGTLERSSLRAVGTPQVFEAGLYRAAAAAFPGKDALDDCEVVERYGRPVAVIEGEVSNIKITVPEDIKKTEFGVKGVRIGHGYDAHRLTEGRKLILGGVRIPHGAGLLGHSDADVLSHAVIDALLGAAALGDIGALFPDTDARFKDADSLSLLREAAAKVRDAGYAVGNIDAAVICQRPKIAGFIGRMRENIAEAAGTDAGNVSVKATTEEGMGFTGELKGISAHAAALLIKM